MGALVEGKWHKGWHDTAQTGGRYVRAAARFRNFVTADGSSGFRAEPDRYHLYVARACPWCHRAMILRALKKLEGIVSMSAVEPVMGDNGWTFAAPDPLTGAQYIHEVYRAADPRYSGRASVPVLWDKRTRTIVNNESSEIIRMFNREFAAFTDGRADFYPASLADEIDRVNERVFANFNNGVYRAGFATTQAAYDEAVKAVFETLDWLEARLTHARFVVGDVLTEADWRLFPTLARFDGVYHGHFKCNLRRLVDYKAVAAYARRLYEMPGIAATCAFDEYKLHYYASHRTINPTGIVPAGPLVDFRTAQA
ncbi:MAG: glutathione S-transferase family protein [Alphaproteobacteria bacterium]|nr:glutathione S-transferase family protein [Alphaproteobacteria bacterium]